MIHNRQRTVKNSSKNIVKTLVILLVCMALLLSACSSRGILAAGTGEVREVQSTSLIADASTPNIVLVTAVPIPTRDPAMYPEDAEGVVIAFLTAYQSDQEGMDKYLSKAMRKKVPEGGPGMLLQLRDILEGYAVTSAAVNQDPPAAVIAVAVKVAGTADSSRKFTLSQEDGKWVINGIEVPKKSE